MESKNVGSRRQYAYDVLRDRILSLGYKPNDLILEGDVAEELGVSRTPVREAIAALEREQLVRIIRGRGAFVAPTSGRRVLETYQVREVLEGLAARLCIGRVSAVDLRDLKSTFEDCVTGRLQDIQLMVSAANRLHEVIAEAANNEYLRYNLQAMSDQVIRLRMVSINREARLQESSREHMEIIDAILASDAETAETVMRQHIRAVRVSLEKVMNQRSLIEMENQIGF